MTLSDVLSILQGSAVIGGAGLAVWKIASTTGALGREIKHLGDTITDLREVVHTMGTEIHSISTRVAVIEEHHRNGRC